MASDLIVLIPTSGRADLLARTLDSLAGCPLPEVYRETIVIENGPKGGAEEVVGRSNPALRTRYMYRAEANKSKALNAVLDEIDNGLVFLTDDDVRFAPNTLQAYAEAAAGIQTGQVFGGPLGIDYEKEPPDWLKAYLPVGSTGWIPDDKEPTAEPYIFSGANWAVFAADLSRAGGFDPDRGPGAATGSTGQETEMQRRLYRQGFQCTYVPQAMVWHYVPAQRCSIRWALKRARRSGIEFGIEQSGRDASLLGVPRWMIRKWLGQSLRFALTRCVPGTQTRFKAARELCFLSGAIKGSRVARGRVSE